MRIVIHFCLYVSKNPKRNLKIEYYVTLLKIRIIILLKTYVHDDKLITLKEIK